MTADVQDLLHEASRLRREERVAEAIAAYHRLLAHEPKLPDSWYNLGLLQRRAGEYEAALASYRRALDLGVREPEEVHLNRAVIYADFLRDDVAAEWELNGALALNPAYVPALLNLANLREDQGQREDARALYGRILALAPRMPDALARYAMLEGAKSSGDPIIARLGDAIADPEISQAGKATLGFALGSVLDRSGAYDAAFAAYRAANRHSRDSAQGRILYNRDAHSRFVDGIIEAFPDRGPAAPANDGDAPLFICGMFRSGSTLAEQVLARHPRVTAGGELPLLANLVQSSFSPFPEAVKTATAETFAIAAAQYRSGVRKLFPNADRVTDKRPDNFLYLGLIKRMFPSANIVHTVRDALDTCLSIYFLHLDHRMGYALDLGDIAHYFGEYRRLMAHWKSLYPRDIRDFDYDAFVREPKANAEGLLSFCGLEWTDACLEPHLAAGAVKTASVWQVREPLYRRSSGRWRNYERHLGPLYDAGLRGSKTTGR
jgi:tetratricopeptide (TPR) repeat protein